VVDPEGAQAWCIRRSSTSVRHTRTLPGKEATMMRKLDSRTSGSIHAQLPSDMGYGPVPVPVNEHERQIRV
jgi:hypothetical protein